MGDADSELVVRFRRGDLEAFSAIYRRYRDRLYGFVLGIFGRSQMAEDVVQEIFSRFFQNSERLQSNGSVRSFLFSCAHHLAIDTLRRKANRASSLNGDGALPLVPAADDQAIREEDLERITREIMALPVEQREVVLLKVYEGMTLEEIARVQSVAVGTVASRYHYALEHIRRALEIPKGVLP